MASESSEGARLERLRALLAGWFLDLAERVDAPADLRGLHDVVPAPPWTLRAGFETPPARADGPTRPRRRLECRPT